MPLSLHVHCCQMCSNVPIVVIAITYSCTTHTHTHMHTHTHTHTHTARSPLYAHISTTVQGLPTIRSCLMEEDMTERYYHYQDENTKGWYLYLAFTRWFGIRINIMTALFITAVAFLSIWLAECKSLHWRAGFIAGSFILQGRRKRSG